MHLRLGTCTPLSHDGDYSLTRPITFKFGGSIPEPGHGGSFSVIGDGEAGRSSETAEFSSARRQWSRKGLGAAELAKAQMLRRWFELRGGVAGPGLAEDRADQSKDDEIQRRRCWSGFGVGRAVQGWEMAELTRARPSAIKFGGQITPKILLRCMNYGDSFI